MKKLFNNLTDKSVRQEGSTFVFVIMIISILSVLGLALITASFTNWMINVAYVDANSAFYKADGTMEKVQAVLERASIKAQNHARESANAVIKQGEMTDEEYEKLVRETYQNAYNQYICTGEGKDYIDDEINALAVDEVFISYKISADSEDSIYIEVDVQKTVNKIRKTVTAVFQLLKQPELLVIEKKVNVNQKNNPLLIRPITTEKNLVVVGSEVSIETQDENDIAVYAWGTVPDGNNQTSDKYGGIIAGLVPNIAYNIGIRRSLDSQNVNLPQKGMLNILGRAITGSYIHTFYGNSIITIGSNSNYDDIIAVAQSTQTEKESRGGQIRINGNLLLADDLEVNGQGDYIKVEGSLFAFRSGPASDKFGYNFHNQSSSIIYNDSSYESIIDIGKQIFIGGVAFVESVYRHREEDNLFIPYKTGESISIGGNYNSYRYHFDDDGEYFFDDQWRLRIGMQPDDEKDPYFPMYSGVGEDLSELDRERERNLFPNEDGMNRVRRFADYVKEWSTDKDKYDSYVAMGNTNLITGEPFDYIRIGSNNRGRIEGYSLGTVPANGKVYFPLYDSYIKNNPRFTQEEKDKYYNAGVRPFDNLYSEKFYTELQYKWESEYNNSTYILQGNYSKPKEKSEFDLLVDESVIDTSSTGFLIKSNSRSYLYLVNEKDPPETVLDLAKFPQKRGLIYSNGDIYITNSSGEEATFEGAIVAKGNIVFFGNGKSQIRIKYDEQAVKDAVKLDANAVKFFSKGADIDRQEETEVKMQVTTNVRVVSWKETNKVLK